MSFDSTKRPRQVFSEPRREVQDGETERRNTLHAYGLDLLTTADLRCYFKPPIGSVQIQWLNDSACNVEYETEVAALEAVRRLKRGPPMEGGWYPAVPIRRKGISIQLSFRFATELDTKENLKTKESQFLYRVSKKRARVAILRDGEMDVEKGNGVKSKIQKKRKNRKRARNRNRRSLDTRVDAMADSMGKMMELKEDENSDHMQSN